MAKKLCLKQVSTNIDWEIDSDKAWRYMKESLLLRIAEATELMAQNHRELVRDRDRFEEYWREEQERRVRLENQIAGLRGYITRLKKRCL